MGDWSPYGAALSLLMLALTAVALLAVLWIAARRSCLAHDLVPPTLIEMLQDRYARGEIDHYELDERLETLLRGGTEGDRRFRAP